VGKDQDRSLTVLMEKLLPARKIQVAHGLKVYPLPDGSTVELYGPGACYPPYLFSHGDVVIGYRVNDLRQTVEQLTRQGCQLLGEVVSICAYHCYCFMEVNETSIIGLYQLPAAL